MLNANLSSSGGGDAIGGVNNTGLRLSAPPATSPPWSAVSPSVSATKGYPRPVGKSIFQRRVSRDEQKARPEIVGHTLHRWTIDGGSGQGERGRNGGRKGELLVGVEVSLPTERT